MYATPWRATNRTHGQPPAEVLRLGRLAAFYSTSEQQLPRVLRKEVHKSEMVGFRRWQDIARVTGACSWLFVLPSGQVVGAFTVDLACELVTTVPVLEDGYYAQITISGRALPDQLAALGGDHLSQGGVEMVLSPERHQLVFASVTDQANVPNDDTIQRIIYRSDLPYRPEYSAITYPPELNRRPTTVGAVGPYVSVLAGHQDYVENTLLLSAVQTVGATARLREVREVGYRALRSFRATTHGAMSTRQRRQVLGDLAEQLSELEVELSFSVEAAADLGMLIPSLRTESFHQALYRSMDMSARATTVARMLQRLERSIAAELTAVESVERRADEQQRLRWAVAIGFLTTVAAPLGLLLSFFGVATSEVVPATSMFDRRYAWAYVTLSLIMLIGLLLFLLLYLRERRDALQERRDPRHGRDRARPHDKVDPPTRIKHVPERLPEPVTAPEQAPGVAAQPAADTTSS